MTRDKERLYEDARELYEDELRTLVKEGFNGSKNLEAHYQLLDCILDTYKICKKDMEKEEMYDEMQSQRGYNNGRSQYPYYAMNSMNGDMSGMGYMNNRSYNGNYNYGNSRNSVVDHIQTMIDNAKSDNERQMYQRWLEEAKRTV